MVDIGGKPILWHIMKTYSSFGHNDFIICCGYKGELIKDYFANYYLRYSDVCFDFCDEKNNYETLKAPKEKWRVTLVDTGLNTQTAGRLSRVKQYLDDEDFFLTYGDGVSDIDLDNLLSFHKDHGKIATVSAMQPLGRFGALEINDGQVDQFVEKPIGERGWINGGFFVLSPDVFNHIPENADDVMWEQAPMKSLSGNGELMAYQHHGFWQPMDTLRERNKLKEMVESQTAPWIQWDD
jgi:glucose-1-phosphate cytidylyltransferase